MSDQQPAGDRNTERSRRPGPWPPNWVIPRSRRQAHRRPRWVTVLGVVGALAVVLIVVMLLAGHGPGRHLHQGSGAALERLG